MPVVATRETWDVRCDGQTCPVGLVAEFNDVWLTKQDAIEQWRTELDGIVTPEGLAFCLVHKTVGCMCGGDLPGQRGPIKSTSALPLTTRNDAGD